MTTTNSAPATGAPKTPDAAPATNAVPTEPVKDAKPAEASTTNSQPTDSQPAKPEGETNSDSTDNATKTGAPEQYADFKLPEGATIDPTMVDKFKAIAKEFNLSQEQAQKFADLQSESVAAFQAQLAETKTRWQSDTKTDKEFGGDKLGENLAIAHKPLQAFGTDALRTLLEQTGLADHPEIVRVFWKIGQRMSEDNFVPAGKASAPEKSIADRLYPNQSKRN